MQLACVDGERDSYRCRDATTLMSPYPEMAMISGTHWERHCVSTDGPRKSGQTFSRIRACRLPTVCTTTRIKTISAKPSVELRLSCYEMLRKRKSQIRKVLKTKDLVPAVGLEPTT